MVKKHLSHSFLHILSDLGRIKTQNTRIIEHSENKDYYAICTSTPVKHSAGMHAARMPKAQSSGH